MLIRASDLRFEIMQFCVEWEIDYLLLNQNEWSHIEYLIKLLKSFCLFIKILSITRTTTINIVFKIYNRSFEHLKKTKFRFARKRVAWKKSLLMTFECTRRKLSKYYNQIQNELELLYDKTILLHSIVDEILFQIAEWKIESKKTSWHKIYWSALKEMYDEYKQHTIETVMKQSNLDEKNQTLNDILNDDVTVQTSFEKNEFTFYQRQDNVSISINLFINSRITLIH